MEKFSDGKGRQQKHLRIQIHKLCLLIFGYGCVLLSMLLTINIWLRFVWI